MSKEEVAARWARIRGRLRAEFGDAAYRNWLRALTLVELRDGTVRIAAPTRFKRDWIDNQVRPRRATIFSCSVASQTASAEKSGRTRDRW